MTNFEDRLLDQLKQHEPDPGAALRPRRRRAPVAAVAAVAITVVAAVAAVVLPSLGDGGPTAHAVTRNPDGTLAITVRHLDDVEKANRELRDLDVTNVVLVGYSEPGSCAPEDLPGPGGPYPEGMLRDVTDDAGWRKIIRLDLIPPDHTLLLVGQHLVTGVWEAIGANDSVVPSQERYCVERWILPTPPHWR